MAIYINGKKIAGIGLQGKSPYDVAKTNGYTGSESTFNQQLSNIDTALNNITALRTEVETICSDAKEEIETVKANAIAEIEALIPDISFDDYYTKSEVDTKLSGIISTPYTTSNSEPTSANDKKLLWISSAGLKYHDGSSWVPVPVCWT